MELEQEKALVKEIANVLSAKKAEDIKIIDIHDITVVADYFVIASAANPLQMNALSDAVEELMYKNSKESKQIEGNRNSTWILMDYEDIIVHLFSTEDRLFYDLDRIWQDGTEISIDDL